MILKSGNSEIAVVLNSKKVPTALKIVNTALDGSTYVQNTGDPIIRYTLDIYCATKAKRDAVDDACNEGERLTLVFADSNSIDGYIEEPAVEWREWRDEHAKGKFTFIKE